MSRKISLLRKHWHFIVIVAILLVAMTWPTVLHVFDTDARWLPTREYDVWIKFWDAWHARSILAGEADLFYTRQAFYPQGLSLAYHPSNVLHVTSFALLQMITEAYSAFNLVYLAFIFATSLSAYIFLIYTFRDAWLALFGAVVFGFSQFVVGHPQHPDVYFLITIPLSLYALQRAVRERKWRWYFAGGVLTGITAFIGMYILICLLLTLGLYIICFTYREWRKPRFWLGIALLLGVAACISLPRVYPMIRDDSNLDEALSKLQGWETGKDLLSYFVSGGHPVLTPIFVDAFDMSASGALTYRDQHKTSYLGYLPLLLIGLGFCVARQRRKMLPWLFLLLPFLILRLGSTLLINGVSYPEVLLPKHFLNELLPFVFQAFYETDHFQMGILLPFSVLSCFGLQVLLRFIPLRYISLVVIGAVAWVAFEYYQPLDSQVIPDSQLAFNDWLKTEPNQAGIRLINLPMGRRSSKIYGFYQTINGYPHAEGLANRTPAKSYNYILQNYLLRSWHQRGIAYCSADAFDPYLAAADQLLVDGFSHVILHHSEQRVGEIADSFRDIPLAYQDDYVSIYRVSDLRESCLERIAGYQSQLPLLKSFLNSPINQPRGDITLMALYPPDIYSAEARHVYDFALSGWKDLVHVVHDSRGAALVSNVDRNVDRNVESQNIGLENIETKNIIFWLISNPQDSAPSSQNQFSAWAARNLNFCQRIHHDDGMAVDQYIDRAYPCELVVAADPVELIYDNGINLANFLTDFDGESFSLDLWWRRDDIDGHAYTIQVFTESGEKRLQADRVIDSRPLSRVSFNTSGLQPGDYIARLIVYETESGKSQSGAMPSAQTAFERDFEIARFSVSS